MAKDKKLLTIKVGSNVLTNPDGLPDKEVITSISRQIADLKKQGHQVLLISSGAVAAGRSIYHFPKKTDTIAQKQVLSSIGQVKLISLYKEIFDQQDIICSQVLVTKEDFRSRNHYLNMQNCLTALLNNDILPIINENDVISVTELMFTDNDELAGLVSSMMNSDMLIILTNVDGVYDGDPNQKNTQLIDVFDPKKVNLELIKTNGNKSDFGRGGILTKCNTAQKIARMGIPVHIANGKSADIIFKILNREKVGTFFPSRKSTSGIKKYIAHAYEEPKGEIIVNEGAVKVLRSDKANSLLPVGIVKIYGKFKKGDIIKIVDENRKEIGIGIARYSHKKAREVIGLKNQKPIIHYDHLYLH